MWMMEKFWSKNQTNEAKALLNIFPRSIESNTTLVIANIDPITLFMKK